MTPQPSALAALKRYTIEAHAVFGTLVAEALERDWGEYVRWNDVLAAWPTQAQGEAYAYSYRLGDQTFLCNINPATFAKRDGFPAPTDITPLYTHPSPSTAALREALRDLMLKVVAFANNEGANGSFTSMLDSAEHARTLLAGE